MALNIISIIKKNYTQKELFCRFIQGGERADISYKELLQRSFDYKYYFKKVGVKKGDVVLIILKHSPNLLYSFVGAMLNGSIPSILPPPSEKQDISLYRESIEALSRLIKAKSIVTFKENLSEIEIIKKDIGIDVVLPEHISRNTGIEWEWPIAESRDIAFLQHSSGTTGLRKGVALSHTAVLNQIDNYSKTINLHNEDVIVSWLPLYHDMGLIACFILPLLKKIPVVMMDTFEWVNNPSMLFREIQLNKGTLCWLPNFAFNFLANCVDTKSETYDLSSIRVFINCSEPCKVHSFKIFYEKFKCCGLKKEALQTCYAMAENVFAISQSNINKEVRVDHISKSNFFNSHSATKAEHNADCLMFLSVGGIIPNTKIKIVDKYGEELPEKQVGEIAVSSNSLFSGYFKLESESKSVLNNGWLYTGDMGYISDDELYITGRKKDLIIVHGKNYYAHDIEYIANQVEGIKKGRCVAVGIYNELVGSEEAVLIAKTGVESHDERNKIKHNVKLYVNKSINLVLGDVCLVPLKWIIKTTSGKISRSENKKKYLKFK